MNKQLFTFLSLSVVGLACPVGGVIGAPPPPSPPAEVSDRRFLSNLENSDAAQVAPTESAPIPAATPAPPPVAPPPRHDLENRDVIKGERVETAPAPAPRTVRDTDGAKAAPAETTPAVTVRPRRNVESSATAKTVPVEKTQAPVRARRNVESSDVVKTAPAETESASMTVQTHRKEKPAQVKSTVSTRSTVGGIKATQREEISAPAQIAEGAPETQGSPTTVTKVIVTRPAESDHDHEHHRSEHEGFFHRLFNHDRSDD
jgi:hypothetical protein